ncbi:MAG: TraB/GumN family protein [Hydrotalea sp.]|nr:TraB/GumN family protein [Hydrotalea sp.]
MKYIVASLSCWIIWFFLGNQATAQQHNQPKTLLWKISGKELEKDSYLYGTIHVMCPNDLKIAEEIKERLYASKSLVLEMNLSDPAILMSVQKGMIMKDSSLSQLLDSKSYNELATSLSKDYSLNIQMFEKMTPMLGMSMLFPKILGCMPSSWEMELIQLAKQKSLGIGGLETGEDQLKAINSNSLKSQANMLYRTAIQKDSTQESFQKMLNYYQAKDPYGLYEMSNQSEEFASMEADLLIKRNVKWIPEMTKMMKKEPTFFAVGALHLAGQQGVIELLRKEGYTVSPIMY